MNCEAIIYLDIDNNIDTVCIHDNNVSDDLGQISIKRCFMINDLERSKLILGNTVYKLPIDKSGSDKMMDEIMFYLNSKNSLNFQMIRIGINIETPITVKNAIEQSKEQLKNLERLLNDRPVMCGNNLIRF